MNKSVLFGPLLLTSLLIVVSPLNAAPKKPVVFTEIAKATESFEQLIYPAIVSSEINSQIRAEGDGIIRSVHKKLGEKVKAGDLLFTIQNTDPAFSFAPLKVRSFFSGTVGSILVESGSAVQKGTVLGSVTDPTKIKLVVEIPAADVENVKNGKSPSIVSEYETSEKIPLKLLSVAPAVDPTLGTAKAEFALLTQQKNNLLPGTITRIEIKSNPKNTFLVDQDSLVYKEGKEYLRKLNGNTVVYVPVVLGKTRGQNIEIESGLSEGDVYVARSSTFVANGEKVEIFKEENDDLKSGNTLQAR